MLTEEDLRLRRCGIGGSEVGAIFGVDEYSDAFTVWARKKGHLKPPAASDRMIVGSALEEGVLKLYTHVTGREVEYINRTMQHPRHSWMIYTPDAICKHEPIGVDAKVVFWDQRRKWGLTVDDIPQSAVLQGWYYMYAFDFPQWDICALVGESFPRIYPIPRDQEGERVMLARLEEWHARYIIGNERPPFGRSRDAAVWLQQAFPDHKRHDMREASPVECDLLDQYVEIVRAQRELKGTRREVESHLKAAIADREGLNWPGGCVTWRRTKDSEVTDYQSMALGLLYAQIKDEAARKAHIAEFTRSKPGTRRMLLSADDLPKGSQDETD